MTSNDSTKTSGTVRGQAFTALEDGSKITSPVSGSFSYEGRQVDVVFCDAASNGVMNFVNWSWDAIDRDVSVQYWELKPAKM